MDPIAGDFFAGEVDRLRELLRRLEWAGSRGCADCWEGDDCCPACGAERGDDPHEHGCWLAKEIGTERRSTPGPRRIL